jgi:hypothetical protein
VGSEHLLKQLPTPQMNSTKFDTDVLIVAEARLGSPLPFSG